MRLWNGEWIYYEQHVCPTAQCMAKRAPVVLCGACETDLNKRNIRSCENQARSAEGRAAAARVVALELEAQERRHALAVVREHSFRESA